MQDAVDAGAVEQQGQLLREQVRLAGAALAEQVGEVCRQCELLLVGDDGGRVAAFADGLAERSGAVLNVSSVMAWLSMAGSYSVSKAAMWSATDAVRTELTPRGIQVTGLYVALVDTDMSRKLDGPKSDPADVVRTALDGLEAGDLEVLADDQTRWVPGQLHRPVPERFAPQEQSA